MFYLLQESNLKLNKIKLFGEGKLLYIFKNILNYLF